MARLRMFAGPNGSGKSSLYARLVEEGHFHPTTFIKADEIQNRLDSRATVSFPLEAGSDFIERLRSSPFLAHGLSRDDIDSLTGNPEKGLCLKPGHVCGPYLSAAIADLVRVMLIKGQHTFAFETVMSHSSKLELLAQARSAGLSELSLFCDDRRSCAER